MLDSTISTSITNSDSKKRELSLSPSTPQPSATTPMTKRAKIDSLFNNNSDNESNSNNASDEEFPNFWDNHSPVVGERLPLHTPTRDDSQWSAQHDLLGQVIEDDDEDEEEDGSMMNERYSLGDKPFRRSLYSELLLSSNLGPEDDEALQDSRRKSAIIVSSLFEDDEIVDGDGDEETEDDKTTLPLSRPYVPKPIVYDDEVDAFFSSYNPPAEEPEFVLSSALKMSILQQQHKHIPDYITEWPHFITSDYFKTHHFHDKFITSPDKEAEEESHQPSTTPYFDSNFSILKNMGSGEYAEVWKTRNLNTNEINAIKKSKTPFTGWDDRWQQLIEVEHLESVKSSKHCISLVNAWEERGYMYIQLELCSSGSLDNYIKFKNGKIPEEIVWKIFYEIVMGVQDIHQADIVHLDLKPSNILIDDRGVIKIGDFGISLHTPVDMRLVKGEGDRRYMAPDLLREDFDKPADIFSLGVILLELATGIVLPGTGESWEMLRTGDFSKQKMALSKLSNEMSEMIQWLLITESKERPTITDIISHPTFARIGQIVKQEQSSSLLSYVYEMERLAAEEAERLQHRNAFSTPEGRVF